MGLLYCWWGLLNGSECGDTNTMDTEDNEGTDTVCAGQAFKSQTLELPAIYHTVLYGTIRTKCVYIPINSHANLMRITVNSYE